jgi:RimJ/RimL family protein N-acetyltransferase
MEPVHLRPTTRDDLDFVLAAELDPDNRPFVVAWTREQHAAALHDSDLAHLIIEHRITRDRAGFVILAGLANPNLSLEFRRIVVTAKRMGIGRAVVRLVKRFAFRQHGAHRLWLDVKEHNVRARRLYEAEGFIVEGVLRECLRGDSVFASLVVMSLLASEYPEA